MIAGEKRSQDRDESLLKENHIVVDIEGTTTSITFVKEKLFPYVRENVKSYLDAKWEDEEFKKDLEKLKEQAKKDEEDKTEGLVPISGSNVDEEKESVVKNVLWQMDGDRKSGALKQLQGHMWREAYDSGKIKGHVYEDVPECLKSWKNCGKKIYVYSSGSVEAQKLLFGHSEHGDLLEYFSGYFDTEIGMKQETASYEKILSQIKAEGSDVLFLTDIVKEAKAAKEAGLSTIIMIREGNAELSDADKAEYKTAKSFLDLSFANAAKRPKLETPVEAATKEEKGKAEKPPQETVEKMEVSEDVEMKDVSENDKDSGAKVDATKESKGECETSEAKSSAIDNDKKETRVEGATSESKSVAENKEDEAMETETIETTETDGKKEEKIIKKIDETITSDNKETAKVETTKSEKISSSKVEDDKKSVESTKSEEKETKAELSDEKKVSADETDKAVVKEIKKLEIPDKKEEEISSKDKLEPAVKMQTNDDSAADVAMEESFVPQSSDKNSTNISDSSNAVKETKTEVCSEQKKDKLSLNTETEKKEVGGAESEAKQTSNEIKENSSKDKESALVKKLPEDEETNKDKSSDSENKSSKLNETSSSSSKSEESLAKSNEMVTEDIVKENGTSSSASVSEKIDISLKTEIEKSSAVIDAKKEAETDKKKTDNNDIEESIVAGESKEVVEPVSKSKEEDKEKEKEKSKTSESSIVVSTTDVQNKSETKDPSVDNKSTEDKQSEKDNLTNTDSKFEQSKEITTNAAAAAVEQTIKKINGTAASSSSTTTTTTTTQNGKDSSPSANNDNQIKIHTNGVNEACTSDAVTTDAKTNNKETATAAAAGTGATAAQSSSSSSTSSSSSSSPQKREPESSTDPSAESIKVKKVVDSTVADGAGEPDVVPPAVVVAATS